MALPWWAPVAIGAGAAYLLRPSRARADVEEEESDLVPDLEDHSEQQHYEPMPGLSPLWPLPTAPRKWWPKSFGGRRPWKSPDPSHHHKGVDIHAPEGAPVVAPTDGTVLSDSGWSGPNTRGVMFQSDGGPVLVFGAVAPGSYRDDFPYRVKRGEKIAEIGRYPGGSTMLHLELYKVGTRKRVVWPWGTPQPETLVNPHPYLLATTTT